MKTIKTFDEHLKEAKINEAKSISATITEEIKGDDGNQLYCVIRIDTDDPEDSSIELWRANNPPDLKEKIREEYFEYSGQEDEEEREWSQKTFDEDWGFSILPTLIGRI